MFRQLGPTRFLPVPLLLGLASGCMPEHVVARDVLSVSGGGSGEAWIVVHEVEGDLGSIDVDTNRYVVYQCLPLGCKPVSTLKGTERTHIDLPSKGNR